MSLPISSNIFFLQRSRWYFFILFVLFTISVVAIFISGCVFICKTIALVFLFFYALFLYKTQSGGTHKKSVQQLLFLQNRTWKLGWRDEGHSAFLRKNSIVTSALVILHFQSQKTKKHWVFLVFKDQMPIVQWKKLLFCLRFEG